MEDYCICGHKKSSHYFPQEQKRDSIGKEIAKSLYEEGQCTRMVHLTDITYGARTPIIYKFEEDPHPFVWFCKCNKYEKLPIDWYKENGWVKVYV